MDYAQGKRQQQPLTPQLFNQPKGIKMKAPLSIKIAVEVKDADGNTCYAADHTWSGMSEEYEVEFLAGLHEAVFNLGRAKLAGNASKKPA